MTSETAEKTVCTVLLVDDDEHVRSALTRLLRADGHRILAGGSAAEGLDLLAQHSVQVVLSDQQMPGITGTKFLSKVKDLYPQTIRMLLSGHADPDAVTEAITQGAVHCFFAKPWDNDALRRNIRKAFDHRSLVHGQLGTTRSGTQILLGVESAQRRR